MNIFNIKKASAILNQGGVIAYPTEAVFGLGCDPMNAQAVAKLLHLKKRTIEKGLILVAADYEQLEPFIGNIPTPLFNKIMESWPGPTNWLLPPNSSAPKYLRGEHPLQAVRISESPIIQALCRHFGGAIISTSANLSHRPPAKNALQTRLRFKKQIDYILNEPVGEEKQPCEIRNGLNNQIIRSAS